MESSPVRARGSFPIRQPADQSLQARFPLADAGYKKFNSRPVVPTWSINGSSQQFAASRFTFGPATLHPIYLVARSVQSANQFRLGKQ
jgi:hypothetical protein